MGGRIDFGYIRHHIGLILEGKDTSDCLSYPEKYWRRFPGCKAEPRPRDDKPTHIFSLDEETG